MIKLIKTNKLMHQLALNLRDRYSLASRGLTSNKSYVASEAFYHLLGGRHSKLTPMYLDLPNKKQHWWILDRNGNVYDVFASEHEDSFPYATGKAGNFKSYGPSNKARRLMDGVLLACS